MKKLLMVLPLVFLLCFTFGCQKGEETVEKPAVDVEADVEAINNLETEFDRTGMVGDVDGQIELVSDDAVFMQPNGQTVIGKQAIYTWTRASFDMFTFESKHSPERIDIINDWAIVPGYCKGTVTPKSGGDPIPFNNKYLHIYRKQTDGTWKLSRSIWNSNDPLPVSEENK